MRADWTVKKGQDLLRAPVQAGQDFAMLSVVLGTGKRTALVKALQGHWIVGCPAALKKEWEGIFHKEKAFLRYGSVFSNHYLRLHIHEMVNTLREAEGLILEAPRGPKTVETLCNFRVYAKQTIIVDHAAELARQYAGLGPDPAVWAATKLLGTPGLCQPSFLIEGPMLSGKGQ